MNKEEFKEALEPIAQGLFGKQGARRYERPHFPLRPLETMLKDLTEIEPVDWYHYAFSRENLNGKFNEEQRRAWMEKAIECGKEYAEIIRKKYQSANPEHIAKHMGMEVSYPIYPEKTERVMFAEYREPNNINIYMDAVRKAKRFQDKPEIGAVLTSSLNVPKLLLSHELFHAVEDQYKDEIFTQNEKTLLWSIGPIHHYSKVLVLSEIAAMAFAAELTHLPYSPYVMDVFLVYGYSPEEASGLYEEMMELAGRTPCDPINN